MSMTESERLTERNEKGGACSSKDFTDIVGKLADYEEIGTVSEFRELKEKATAKKVQYDEYGRDEGYPHCSSCGDSLINDFVNVNYCPSCGQKLDWSEGKE